MTRMPGRSAWLDLLRAAAIVAVVGYHVVQMSPLGASPMSTFTRYGQFGVDLFFVLSGWLVGTLFWTELQQFGNVAIVRFWARRAWRTIPPYLVALLASWSAVAATRGEPFFPEYLIFIQNYFERIPYFLVSWSLCVEEHFYALAPTLTMLIFVTLGRAALQWALAALVIASPVIRIFDYDLLDKSVFGYYSTATHLRLDGLALGFFASYYYCTCKINHLRSITNRRRLKVAILIGLVTVASIEIAGGGLKHILFIHILSYLFCLIIIYGTSNIIYINSTFRKLTTAIALSSYSAYLVHPLAIHVTRNILDRLDIYRTIFYFPLAVSLICASTAAFYIIVERTSINFRDIMTPRRVLIDKGPSLPVQRSARGGS